MFARSSGKAFISLCAVLAVSAKESEDSLARVCGKSGEVQGECASLLQFEKKMESKHQKQALASEATFDRFCGIAANNEQGNSYSSSDLATAAAVSGMSAQKIWHYNWQSSSRNVHIEGAQFVPMIKYPGSGRHLPPANQDGRGSVVKGWNEPDDQGQAGRDSNLRSNPEAFAQAWTSDMQAAQAKGYTEFVSPAMAFDTCWLDHFLKACEVTAGCRHLVTYLAFHRYRQDCSTYSADPDNMGFRDDLSYVLTYYRLLQKYNARGFNIKGLVWDELGCLTSSWTASPESHQLRYMREWYQSTLVKVKNGDAGTINKIRGTNWIMPKGPDAHAGQAYRLGACGAQNGGATAAEDAVKAIQSLVTVAWFSISPGKNHLFRGRGQQGLSQLGQTYFDACKTVQQSSGNGNGNGNGNGQDDDHAGCRDSDASCQHWASLGYCAEGNTYEAYMHQTCKLSCNVCDTGGDDNGHDNGSGDGDSGSGDGNGNGGDGSSDGACEDANEHCQHWAGLGYCEEGNTHEEYMHDHCRLSCGVCGGAGSGSGNDSGGCEDTDTHCPHWANSGYCTEGNTYEEFMKGACRLSCNFCR